MLFLVAVEQSNIYDVLIVALPGLIAAISSIVMGIINSKNTNDNKKAINSNNDAINENIAATNENKNAIHKISKEVNGNLATLIEAKEKIAFIKGAGNINVNDIFKISKQLDDIWGYLKQRALTEALTKGFVYSHDNQLVVSDEIRLGYQSILIELKKWYQKNKNLDELQLFKSCQEQFGKILIERICKQYNIFDGSCVQIAVMLAKEE